MKHTLLLYTAVAALAVTSCAKTGMVDPNVSDYRDGSISFTVAQRNMTKATLQSVGHYNFGVFAYKSTDQTNNVMSNYLVGYCDATNKKGYYMTTANQSTMGDGGATTDGASMWQYERLGSSEYTYNESAGYYKASQTAYMSNNANQYLRYWDYSSTSTTFYAYAPYINGSGTATFAYVGTEKKPTLTIPDGTIEAGYVEGSNASDLSDYLYAAAEVPVANYGKDVQLNFKRLNAKVNIKFWENLDGYSVKILNLTSDYGVSAAPAKYTSGATPEYILGEYYQKSGAVINFTDVTNPSVTQATGTTSQAALKFTSPTADAIGESSANATASPTTYYAIPKNNDTGFTFHVSYQLTSTTGEVIKVQDATVYVPADYTNWTANNWYTYTFKITKNTSGTTGDPGTIDPDDPSVDPQTALYPIIFDNCTVVDYTASSAESNLN